MRLYRYLSEENYDKEQIWDTLKNECSEYLYSYQKHRKIWI